MRAKTPRMSKRQNATNNRIGRNAFVKNSAKNKIDSMKIILAALIVLSLVFGITRIAMAGLSATGQVNTAVIDSTSPEVMLISPAIDEITLSRDLSFIFNATDQQWANISECSLIINGTLNDSINDVAYRTSSFGLLPNINQTINVSGFEPGTYAWQVICTEERDILLDSPSSNKSSQSQTRYFRIDSPPPAPAPVNVTSHIENTTMTWTASEGAVKYRVYSTDALSQPFVLLNETSDTLFADTNMTSKMRFYRLAAVSVGGAESITEQIYGRVTYELMRLPGGNTRNWISFPLNSTYGNAKAFLYNMTNVTAITMFDPVTQTAITCNKLSCPTIGCTENNCNFNITPGTSYEVNLNGSSFPAVNWSYSGIVSEPIVLSFYKVDGTYSRNWISLPANTSLTTAQTLSNSLVNISMIRRWNSLTQRIETRTRLNSGAGTGPNFILYPYEGYEVIPKTNFTWVQR